MTPLSKSLRSFAQTHRRILLWLAIGGVAVATSLDLLPKVTMHLENTHAGHLGLWAALALYVALLAIPFVPGAEVGLALLLVFGAAVALPVYIATVVALSVSYFLGRMALQCGHSGRSENTESLPSALAGANQQPHLLRWARHLMRFRWLALIALINTPGNTVIGGGGGIAMAVGYSRAFTYPAFLACVALAVAPVPAMILIVEHLEVASWPTRWMQAAIGGAPPVAVDD